MADAEIQAELFGIGIFRDDVWETSSGEMSRGIAWVNDRVNC